MTPSQQEFYDQLIANNSKFMAADRTEPRNPYPHLAHLTTPAERYKNLVESPKYNSRGWRGSNRNAVEDGGAIA